MLGFYFKLNFNLNAGAGNWVTKCSLSEGCIFQFCISVKREGGGLNLATWSPTLVVLLYRFAVYIILEMSWWNCKFISCVGSKLFEWCFSVNVIVNDRVWNMCWVPVNARRSVDSNGNTCDSADRLPCSCLGRNTSYADSFIAIFLSLSRQMPDCNLRLAPPFLLSV